MNCADCHNRFDDYVDGDLDAAEARAVETHLDRCELCRARLASLRALLAQTAALPREIAPQRDLWREIELEPAANHWVARQRSRAGSPTRPRSPARWRWAAPLAVAATIVFLASIAERRFRFSDHDRDRARDRGPGWSVAAVAGAPRVGANAIEGEGRFRLGQWLETDAASRAKVTVGDIGEVTVDPNSRLRLAGVAATDHRLELARGSLSALIWAPPRLFFVDTPSATAVDLGCAYTLAVDDAGHGELEVTLGYVALEHGERESIVPMGMKCLTRRGAGPGTPFDADAPATLRRALARFDFDPGAARGVAALGEILAQARAGDAITLWHLLARTKGEARARVFDTLAKLATPPAGVTREGILAGDAAMRHAWGTALGLGSFARK